ncbi:hypothetical protein BH20ACI1_BH20ACI1_13740 [soil metagenome]
MKNYNFLILPLISLTLFFCIAAQLNCQSKNKTEAGKNMNMNKNKSEKMPDEEVSQPNEIKTQTIDEGTNSKIETPFIFVVRSAETYAQLQSFAENLPPASQFDFDKSAVIAAFAGTKNTGGYSVEIKKSADKIAVELIAPPKDAMTTQALTTPYKIVLTPIEAEDNLWLEIAENWQNTAETYKISVGEFEYSGGIAGLVKKFKAEGTIKILRFGDNLTLIFNLSGKDTEKSRKLNAAASGKIKDGKIDVPRLDAGGFAENPKPPLKVSGTLTNNKLNLTFEPLPTNVADGFQVQGKIEADKTK